MPEEKLFSDVQALETNSNEYNETVPRDADRKKAREEKKEKIVGERDKQKEEWRKRSCLKQTRTFGALDKHSNSC